MEETFEHVLKCLSLSTDHRHTTLLADLEQNLLKINFPQAIAENIQHGIAELQRKRLVP
jgi:hypothetical protein